MSARVLVCLALALGAATTPVASQDLGAVREAIASTVREHLAAENAEIAVEILQAPGLSGDVASASPLPGARLGQPSRFVVVTADGARHTTVARVSVSTGHVVAMVALLRDVTPVAEAVEWRYAAIDGVPLEPLPTLTEVLAARTRRAIAAGEVLTRTVLARPLAVRAGDPVTMTVRHGAVEARGIGRAVSSGHIGDVIRVVTPGSRQPARARVIAAAAVEILR